MVSNPSTTIGGIATYTCNIGYQLEDGATRTCQEGGTWSGSPPVCIVVNCGQLVHPTNGQVNFANTIYNAVATYTCSTGFSLSGSSIRMCQTDGSWSGAAPTCVDGTSFVILVCSMCSIYPFGTCKITSQIQFSILYYL